MHRKQNIIIFSAGESVRNGKVEYIKKRLGEYGVNSMDWRDLFSSAHNKEQIALLPCLSKKIPTFDFALIIAEGVDNATMRGDTEIAKVMRDNVVFELGLCVMALGSDRVILLAEDCVHIPDDLIGMGKIGISHVVFAKNDFDSAISDIGRMISEKSAGAKEAFQKQLDSIINHININSEVVSPVFIGAAVSSAESYFINFIIRLLESVDNPYYEFNSASEPVNFPDDFSVSILFPRSVNIATKNMIADYFKEIGAKEYYIKNAGLRLLSFHAVSDKNSGSLNIVDIPTSITASYSVVNSILNIDSDDDYDVEAEQRFIQKELDIYIYTLKKLINPEIAVKRLSLFMDGARLEKILNLLKNISIKQIK